MKAPEPEHLVDLGRFTGVPVRLHIRTGHLELGEGVAGDPPGARRREQVEGVLREPSAEGPRVLYRLYRDVRRRVDEHVFVAAGLRYDLTVTLPGTVGAEYVKTAGHYHPPSATGVSFPEIYEVVHGRAAFVLQHVPDQAADRPEVVAVWVQLCSVGDRIIIPPDCGHVTVNIGPTPLVVADLISVHCGHVYEPFRVSQGAAYYVLQDRTATHGVRLEPNPRYQQPPEAIVAVGSRWDSGLGEGPPVYSQFRQQPDRFAFLQQPDERGRQLLALWHNDRSPQPD